MHTFNSIINNQLTSYKGMYECDCAHLQRSLPFRAVFTKHVIDDIVSFFTIEKSSNFVYVTQGPGGLFFDFVLINKLIDLGYRSITVILIEELYEENIDIIQACLDFKEWFREIERTGPNHPLVRSFFYKTVEEYAQACGRNPDIRGHILLTVDPDDKKTGPDFESRKFRKQFSKTLQKTMRASAAFYTLYFQNNLRHMLLGRLYQEDKQLIVAYEHHYGDQNFTDKHNRLFLNNHEALFFESIEHSIQVNSQIRRSQKLSKLLKTPLKT